MLEVGIYPNNIRGVDRSVKPVSGKIVICALSGELTVKRLKGACGMIALALAGFSKIKN